MDALHIVAEGELTIAAAARIHDGWRSAVDAAPDGPTWHLDLGAVSEIDSAGVQLLLSLAQSAAELGRALQLRAPSAAVVEALSSFGLTGLLTPAGAHA